MKQNGYFLIWSFRRAIHPLHWTSAIQVLGMAASGHFRRPRHPAHHSPASYEALLRHKNRSVTRLRPADFVVVYNSPRNIKQGFSGVVRYEEFRRLSEM